MASRSVGSSAAEVTGGLSVATDKHPALEICRERECALWSAHYAEQTWDPAETPSLGRLPRRHAEMDRETWRFPHSASHSQDSSACSPSAVEVPD